MGKPHLVYKGGLWWRFRDRNHHKEFVEYAFGRGPATWDPCQMTWPNGKRRYIKRK